MPVRCADWPSSGIGECRSSGEGRLVTVRQSDRGTHRLPCARRPLPLTNVSEIPATLDYDATEGTQSANDSYRFSLRCVAKRPQHRVDACLVAVTLRLEPREYVLIDAQRNRCLGWHRLEPDSGDTADDMFETRLGMFWRQPHILVRHRSHTGDVTSGMLRRRSRLPGSWLCGTR